MTSKTIITTLIAAALCVSSAIAQDANVISVFGESTVVTPTDKVEIVASLKGSAETMAEAVEQFRNQKQAFIDKMNPMDFSDVSLEYQGQSVTNEMGPFGMGCIDVMAMPVPEGNPETGVVPFTISENVAISMQYEAGKFEETMEKVGKIIDTMQKIEVSVSPTVNELNYSGSTSKPLVVASVSDRSAAEKKAMAEALADARSKAETLAELSGVKLGKIVGIAESEESLSMAEMQAIYYSIDASSDDQTVGEMEITKRLNVRFSIE